MTKQTTIRGTVRKISLEGGVFALITDEGRQIELIDPPAELQKSGARAEIVLDRSGADATIGMVGDAARVRSFTLL